MVIKILLSRYALRIITLGILFFSGWLLPAFLVAQTTTPSSSWQVVTALQQLEIDNSRNVLLISKLKTLKQQLKSPTPPVIPALLSKAHLLYAVATADAESIELTLNNLQQQKALSTNVIITLNNQLQSVLTTNPSNLTKTALRHQLNTEYTLARILEKRISILQNTQRLTDKIKQSVREWQKKLQLAYYQQQQRAHQDTLAQLIMTLQARQQKWLQHLVDLNQQLKTNDTRHNVLTSAAYSDLEINILHAAEQSNLAQNQLMMAKISNHLAFFNFLPRDRYSLADLENFKNQSNAIISHIHYLQDILHKKIRLLIAQRNLMSTEQAQHSLTDTPQAKNLALIDLLIKRYQHQFNTLLQLQNHTQQLQVSILEQLNKEMLKRQNLPGFDQKAWRLLGLHIVAVPAVAWQALQNFYHVLSTVMHQLPLWRLISCVVYFIGWLIAWDWLNRYLTVSIRRLAKNQQNIFTYHLFTLSLRFLRRNLSGFIVIGLLLGSALLLTLPLATFSLGIRIIIILFGFNLAADFTQIILTNSTLDKNQAKVRLSFGLKHLLFAGKVITIANVVVQQLPEVFDVQVLLDRLFMLFLLVASLILLRSWQLLLEVIDHYLPKKRLYLKGIVRVLSVCIPLALLSNALIGLIGYLALARSIAAYQGLFLIVLTTYLLIKGVLGELLEGASNKMVHYGRNGWLWSEAFLKPLYQLTKIGLLLLAIKSLFQLYHWNEQTWIVKELTRLFNLKLFSLANSNITLISLLKLTAVIAVLIWAARWTREFTYRWLFAYTKDLSLRNSLAIFSQYTVVLIGILLALKVIGINLTALTVVASAFAFGVGLGLRDLANNFICGLLLLVERPVRVGDFVTMGGADGTVTYIGMRAITLLNDVRQAFLVPNTVVFNQTITNWTYHDSIVCVSIPFTLTKVKDPYWVKKIILEVLHANPKVLINPAPNVYVKELDELLMKFELEYYIDFRITSSGSTLKSQLLLTLWERLQQEGIYALH